MTTPFRPLWTSGSDEFQIENEWIWTSSGLRFNFTNWVLGEPNNFAGIEHYLQKNINGTNNKWNDVNHAESDAHFICEGYTNFKPISDPRCQSSLNGVRCSYQPGFGCYCFVSNAVGYYSVISIINIIVTNVALAYRWLEMKPTIFAKINWAISWFLLNPMWKVTCWPNSRMVGYIHNYINASL